jgi:hypothetical protein
MVKAVTALMALALAGCGDLIGDDDSLRVALFAAPSALASASAQALLAAELVAPGRHAVPSGDYCVRFSSLRGQLTARAPAWGGDAGVAAGQAVLVPVAQEYPRRALVDYQAEHAGIETIEAELYDAVSCAKLYAPEHPIAVSALQLEIGGAVDVDGGAAEVQP